MTKDSASIVGDFMSAHVSETIGDWEDVESHLEALLDEIRDVSFKAGFADGFENGNAAATLPNGVAPKEGT